MQEMLIGLEQSIDRIYWMNTCSTTHFTVIDFGCHIRDELKINFRPTLNKTKHFKLVGSGTRRIVSFTILHLSKRQTCVEENRYLISPARRQSGRVIIFYVWFFLSPARRQSHRVIIFCSLFFFYSEAVRGLLIDRYPQAI